MSVNAILSTGQGQGQATNGHYIQKLHSDHVIRVFIAYFGHKIRWLRYFGHRRLFLEVFSESQVNVRSKRSYFQIYTCGQKRYLSWIVFAQESNDVIFFTYGFQTLQKNNI